MERKKIVFLAEVAILAALILLMSFTPLGYLRLPGLSVSLLMIPVAIGAVVVGPAAGAILGCLFGLTSFAQCFMGDVLGASWWRRTCFSPLWCAWSPGPWRAWCAG